MRTQLLVAMALCVIGLSISVANATPPAAMLQTLKANFVEASAMQHVNYYRRHHVRHHRSQCWWQDRWFCRYFW